MNNDFCYAFVEFEDHPCDFKEDFIVGQFTLLKSNLD